MAIEQVCGLCDIAAFFTYAWAMPTELMNGDLSGLQIVATEAAYFSHAFAIPANLLHLVSRLFLLRFKFIENDFDIFEY